MANPAAAANMPQDRWSPPSPDEVRRIAVIENPVIRNLAITHCYAQLSAALATRIGEGANWCTYATWASRQAGSTIRGEDLVARLERRLGARRRVLHPFKTAGRRLLRRGLLQPETRIGRLTAEVHTPFDAFERASAAVARGNLKVFEEIALEFAHYLDEVHADDREHRQAFHRFLDRLRPGDPPDGQRFLRQAFERYEELRLEDDPKLRAELAVLANLEVGLHEQTRLQPEILEALDAASATRRDLGLRALRALFPNAADWRRLLRGPAAALAGTVAATIQRVSTELSREVVTESLMVLSLPHRVGALGEHLDDPYPAALRAPAHPALTELLARFEPDAPELDDCGARDWSDLDQRMHYIVHLFRCMHLNRDLFDRPFTPAQVAELKRGVIPSGEL